VIAYFTNNFNRFTECLKKKKNRGEGKKLKIQLKIFFHALLQRMIILSQSPLILNLYHLLLLLMKKRGYWIFVYAFCLPICD